MSTNGFICGNNTSATNSLRVSSKKMTAGPAVIAVSATAFLVLLSCAAPEESTNERAAVTAVGGESSPSEVVNTLDSGLWAGSFVVGTPLDDDQVATFGSLIIQNTTGGTIVLKAVEPQNIDGLTVLDVQVAVWPDDADPLPRVGVSYDPFPPSDEYQQIDGTEVPYHSWFQIVFAIKRNALADVAVPAFDGVKITYAHGDVTSFTIADAGFEALPPL